jgi:hypothetical protein
MEQAFAEIAGVLPQGGYAVLVLGNSRWQGRPMPTCGILVQLAGEHFEAVEQWSYPLQNRYMSYERHNGADISKEYALVLRKK